MKINGYEVALSEADLDDKLNNQTVDVDLIKPDFPAYRQLSDGDKKAFAHLVKAARMFNDVFLSKTTSWILNSKRRWKTKRRRMHMPPRFCAFSIR